MVVLIVDDNTALRRVIRDVLAGLDAELHECASAEEAFAFGVDASDWVLMDLELNGLDGISATRIIRSVSPATKVCIVTNHDTARLRHEAERAGACAFVSKQDLLALPGVLGAPANKS
jgi:CheY-like chemotaxis protein